LAPQEYCRTYMYDFAQNWFQQLDTDGAQTFRDIISLVSATHGSHHASILVLACCCTWD